MIGDYYRLTKPGIIKGNLIHVLAGLLFAHAYGFSWQAVVGVVAGTVLIIASACVVNNYTDRGIDARMKRTKTRASVTGAVTPRNAMLFATVLFVAGMTLLISLTNLLVVIIGLVAYVFYVFIYAVAKRTTVHSTLVGAIPGALPAMAGYVALSGRLDLAAWLIFLLVLVWQMPHFYAISIFRRDEYKAAGLPVLGVVKGFDQVRWHMGAYLALYVLVVLLIIVSGSINLLGGAVLLMAALYWVRAYLRPVHDQVKWAKTVFGTSLLLTMTLLLAVALDAVTPGLTTLQW